MDVLKAKESEMVNMRVEAEQKCVQEMVNVRNALSKIFSVEEETERQIKEREEADKQRRAAIALSLRDQYAKLAKDNALSPAFTYSYFRPLDLKKNDSQPGKSGKFSSQRRPNTAFK